MTKRLLIIAFALLIALGGLWFLTIRTPSTPQPSTPTQTLADSFSYKGESGKNALVLLKEKASVEQDASGLVVSINSRKADSTKREYWAFHINGQMATVGPADYETKNEDLIEWKVEKY